MAAVAFSNPDTETIRTLLANVRAIAVVGFSPKPSRPSHNIARQLQRLGYRIIPVRPGIAQGLGERAWPDLSSVPERIDLVCLFRNGRYAPQAIEECLRLGIRNLWMQEGCVNEAAAEQARAAGMTVVMDRCILRDYTRLCIR